MKLIFSGLSIAGFMCAAGTALHVLHSDEAVFTVIVFLMFSAVMGVLAKES